MSNNAQYEFPTYSNENQRSTTVASSASYIGPSTIIQIEAPENNSDPQATNRTRFFFKSIIRGASNETWKTMILILLFGFVFNTPRWFEWELKLKEHFYFEVGNQTFFMNGDKRDFDEIYDSLGYDNPFNDTHLNQTNNEYDFDELHHNFGLHITWPNNTINDTNDTMGNDTFHRHSEERLEVQQTSLLKNALYFRYYSLIGSGIVMVVIPLPFFSGVLLSKKSCTIGNSKT